MTRGGFRIASISGIPWLWGLGVAIARFFSVLVHELADVLHARATGGRVIEVTLLMVGGVFRIAEPPRAAKHEAIMALVGPIASVAIAGVAFVIYHLIGTASFNLGRVFAGVLMVVGGFAFLLVIIGDFAARGRRAGARTGSGDRR